jgi:Ca2+-binding RTX toxin-like protein
MDETYTITGNAVSSVRGTVAQTAVERWTINALGGNDSIDASAASVAMTLYGGDGNDTLLGGPGNDSIVGGNGADSLAGNAGNDTLAGGAGTDTLAGGTGADTLSGDADNDQFIWTVGDGAETAVGGDGSDSMLIYGTADADTLTVGDGATSSATGTLSYLSIEAVLVDGNAGNDLIDASASSSGKTLSGGNGNDTLLGGGAADYLAGGDGDDSLLGGGGNDQLLGGDGNDFLDGNAGADNLAAGLGDDLLWLNSLEGPDTIDGQEGSDTLVCSLSGGDDNITLSPTQIVAGYAFTPAGIERVNFDGLAGNDSLSIQGTADADTFTIGDGVITGGGLVVGLAGLESLAIQAGAGDDQFEVQTTTLSTTLLGGDGDDAFVIPATGSGALTVNGQRGSDSYTVDLLALTSRLSVEDSGDVAAARRIRQAARAGKAMFALPDTDAVQISGTPADDDIVVNNAQLLIGQRTVDLGGGLDSLLVRGMGGNDTFRVLNSAIPLALQGNDGFDTFAIQAGVAASVQVNGGSGKGELIVNGSTRRDLMRVTDQRIISANGSTIRYLLVDSLTLNGAAGNDSFSLQNVATPTYVNGDGGDDVLVTDVLSHAIFNGGDQNDRLKIFGTQTNNNIRIGANAVNRGPTYDQIEAIDVLALGGNDYIDATDATIPVAINGGAGDDTIIGSAYDDLLDGAFGNDSIIGLGGDDRLYGREGSDILIGSAGDDLLWGGRGYDQIFSDAKDSINLGGAANSRNGGEVFDR